MYLPHIFLARSNDGDDRFNHNRGFDSPHRFDRGRPDQETIILLFTLFGILLTLLLMLVLLLIQAWAVWKLARVVVNAAEEEKGEGNEVGGKMMERGCAGFLKALGLSSKGKEGDT
ncbi:uncharacterized protein EI97DRAFT_458798 [Westerdykella ornata]|uniref:Uncharacterized protein n=1 Tax=Westerdykella ornata TaxID=318751 RepID=A0A6A6JI75_WESOR|nr:uncharacterized protein EI97DRAFT_458798 [Westerdykella ornata]KAF2275783.1 hypothetical protein EI97DRAFT_458798 [Westerdykella ornata]